MKQLRWTLKKGCLIAAIVYLLIVILFYAVAHEQLEYRDSVTDMLANEAPVGELVQGVVLEQPFSTEDDVLCSVELLMATYEKKVPGTLEVTVADSGEVLGKAIVDTAQLQDNAKCNIDFSPPIEGAAGRTLTLRIQSHDGTPGNAVTVWYGSKMSAGKVEVSQDIPERMQAHVNGSPIGGMLCYQLHTRSYLWFGRYYWYFAAAVGLLLAAYCVRLFWCQRKQKACLGLKVISAFTRYRFLIHQLVARDFKTKYKRSVLGVLWSFLNPLLLMTVQYVVFSTLFKSDIPNFALYLLTGIICFNFFNEASTMALSSIVGNAALITKVYVPKYIYPVTRVLSSTINLLLSLIPLFGVMLITGAAFTPAILLLPFGLICLLAFSMGIGFILSSAMVFFRDTQFLWNVLSMLWMYATPIIYPESIIPAHFALLYKMNPLYHIIRFVRILLMNGISPEPKAYLFCFLSAFATLVIGALIFKKSQDKFILFI